MSDAPAEQRRLSEADKLLLRLRKLPDGLTVVWLRIRAGEVAEFEIMPISQKPSEEVEGQSAGL